MINLASLITNIQAAIAADSALSSLNNQVAFGQMTQTATMPYCIISTIGSSVDAQFGDSFIDNLQIQFSVFDTSMTRASSLIATIGTLFTTTSIAGTLSMRRCSSVRCVCEGQDANQNFVYHASVDFEVKASGN